MLIRRARPAREEVDEAALGLLARHGAQILATARRYAATPEDAEDAYQRGLEILLTKAPTTREADLVPWLKTVVKHEAFALRRHRERHAPVTDDGELGERGSPAAATHDQAERYEDLRQGAEALGQLKPQEIRALLLRAEGYSYAEICEITGWTYTKVNRCLTEGRQALTVRLAGIQGGIECAKLAPLLSALADGEASAEQLARLRPHMKTCLACRATLRAFREAPEKVAVLMPPAAVLGSDPDGGTLRGFLESIAGAAQQKAAVLGDRMGAAAELATGQKIAAMAASAAALAGGGTAAMDHLAGHRGPPQRPAVADARPQQAERVEKEVAVQPAPVPADPVEAKPEPAAPAPEPRRAPGAQARAAQPSAPQRPDPANEFAPDGGGASVGAASASGSTANSGEGAPAATAQAPVAAEPQPAAPPARPAPVAGGGGSSEFAP
jgi:RNA polymerase sigma factor (sigma-70 family)